MRLPFSRRSFRQHEQSWDVDRYIWLENTSTEHILLRLPSGNLRLDMKRSLRFEPDILDQPQVRELIDAGRLLVRR